MGDTDFIAPKAAQSLMAAAASTTGKSGLRSLKELECMEAISSQ